MKCENCGHENAPGARFCAQCGQPLAAAQNDSAHDASQRTEDIAPDSSSSSNEDQSGQPEQPSTPKEPGKLARLSKNAKIAIAAVAAVIVVAIVALVVTRETGPSDSVVESALADRASFAVDSTYGVGDAYSIDSTTITSKQSVDDTEGVGAFFGISDLYSVAVEYEASNSDANVTGSGTMIFGKYEDSDQWMCLSSDLDNSYTATAAISEDKIAANIMYFLNYASGSLSGDYDESGATVNSIDFDESNQSCTVALTYTDSTIFSDAEADVTANFSFSDGTWSFDSSSVDGGSDTISYDKLIGTWTGAFQSASVSMGSECYGGETSTPTITITSVDSDSLKIEGTFTGLIHDHDRLDSSADSSDGDTTMEETEFTATLSSTYVGATYSDGDYYTLGAEIEFPETSDTSVIIEFGFEGSDDPNAAALAVKTYYQCGEYTYYMPDPTEKYIDLYTLTKSE